MHAADSAQRHHAGHDTHLDPVVLQPELEEKSNRTGLGYFEKSRSPYRLPLWRPGLQPFQRLSARRLGPFRRPGENGAAWILGTTESCLALEFRSGAHELQRSLRPLVATQRGALPFPDDLHAAALGHSGWIDQHPARLQWRLPDPVCGAQPKLRFDRVINATRTPRSRLRLQL